MRTIIISTLLSLGALLQSCGNGDEPNSIKASGTIESVNVTISSKTSGQLKQLYFNEGDRIKRGDLLVEIDHDMLDIQLRQAEAGVDLANAQLKLLRSGARREDIKQSEELVKQAKINLDLAKLDLDRSEELYKQDAATEKLLEDSKARYELTVAQYNSAKENLAKVRTIIRPEEIESAQANLKRSVSAVDLLKKSIEDCKVYSPVDGFVSKKFVEAGENVAPSTSLLRISNLETVNLVIYVAETELSKVKLGQNAEITIDAFKDKTYTGRIIFISPEAEFTPKNIQTPEERTKLVFAIKIEIPNPQFELKPGLPADAKIIYQ
jgi:HlyD family secretion protein